MKAYPIAKLAAAAFVLGTIMSVIMLIPNWNGEQASTAADDIDQLLDVMIVLSSYVLSIVVVMLGYALLKFRAKPGDESDGKPIHGNTQVEIAWTLIPTIIVLFAGVYATIVLGNIEKRDDNRMVVDVFSQQYAWRFEYPEQGVTSRELHLPVDRQVEFRMHSYDVLHSFWVPEWRIKKDLVPGITTRGIITPDKLGEYSLICTELCGAGHSTMRSPVVVEEDPDFSVWASKQSPIPKNSTGGATIPTQDANGPKH